MERKDSTRTSALPSQPREGEKGGRMGASQLNYPNVLGTREVEQPVGDEDIVRKPCPHKIYTPPPGLAEKSYLHDYKRRVNKEFGLSLQTYFDLHNFSIQRPNDFWMSLWNYLPVKASVQPTRAIDESKRIDEFPQFYDGARLNYAENILQRTGSAVCVKAISEETLGNPEMMTWDSLRERVQRDADALKSSGFKQGDVCCIIGGSTVRSLVLYLAIGSIGGIIASFATDAGERVLLDRVGQLKPKILFAAASYRYNGKEHDIVERVQKVWDSVERPEGAELICTGEKAPSGWTRFEEFLARGTGRPLEFAQLPFHTPYVVMFSSGTTGTPKGIVHSQGGLIINGMKEHLLNYNHDESAVHYHYAGIGWTLWNIMVGALFTGAQIVLYDGSPFYPSPQKLLEGVLTQGVTSFGAGPRYFTELQKAGVVAKPFVKKVDKLPSAGALLTESMALWIRESFGDICQISTSGGTELCGNFVHGTQTLPVYAGENAIYCLGMDVDIFGPDGRPVPEGESGELVCKKPFPNMPAFFINDPDRKKYRTAYFEGANPHVWTHGDYIRYNPDTKGTVILGRSDGVLNPSGIRFGSGEIYTILERCAKGEVVDAICVGQQRQQDQSERVFLFLQVRGDKLSSDLERRIRKQIQTDLSRRHVPHYFFQVEQIPYNVNGKKLEIPLRAVLSEGNKAFTRRKFTLEEIAQLEKYLPYFKIEEMTGGQPKSKL